jgi:glycosyltransferase involved in cell wall biosynthesis
MSLTIQTTSAGAAASAPTDPMRSLNVALFSTSVTGGGAENHFTRLVEKLGRSARKRLIICLVECCPTAIAGEPVISLGWRSKLDYPRSVWRLARLLKAQQVDVLCAFTRNANFVALAATLLCGRKVFRVITVFDNLVRTSLLKRDPFSRFRRSLEYWSYRRVDLIWANSRDSVQALVRHGGCCDRSVRLVRNPILVERISTRAFEARRGPRPTRRVVLGLGRFSPEKRFEDLVCAFHLIAPAHPDCDLVLVGDGPLRTALNQLVQRLGLADRVRFEGWQDDPVSFYATCDVLVLTSETEGNPNVVLEGMAAGAAIVCTRCTSWIEDFEKVGALVGVPVGDAPGLAHAITGLLDPAKRARIAACARSVVQDFEASQVIASQNAELLAAVAAWRNLPFADTGAEGA